MRTSRSFGDALQNRLEHALDRRARRRRAGFVDQCGPILQGWMVGLPHVGTAGECELQSLDAFAWAPIGAGDPAALEAAIDDGRLPARGEHGANCFAELPVAARAGVRAQIEYRQFAVEQTRNDRPNGMGVEQSHPFVSLPEACDLAGERRVIGIEVKTPAVCDVGRVRRLARAIERLAVEGRGRAEFRRRLTRIERSAAWIAIDVDDRARQLGSHQCRAERLDEIVERVEPPVRILAREPRIDEGRLEADELCPRLGNADDERRIAALDDEPVGTLGGHRAGFSSEGGATAPIASMTAPVLTRLLAVAMSG